MPIRKIKHEKLFRIHDCIRVGRVDTLLAETDNRKPYAVWQAHRIIGNIFFHGRKQRFHTHNEALTAFLSLTPIPRSKEYIDIDGCRNASFREDYTGQLVTVSPVVLKNAHCRLENRLQIAKGGGGCKPDAWNEKVRCESLRYGHKSTWDRQDILGVVNLSGLPRWVKSTMCKRSAKVGWLALRKRISR
ncbi:MAG: hypothetical protein Q4D04_16005 [Clostridia bacterium]|nr:hypothetical protein [Clostridia bacterium]